jgi:hypothetical protein
VDVRIEIADQVEVTYRREAPRLWRALMLYSGDRDIASDAVAEAFAQLLGRGAAVRDPRAWVWRAAFRIAAGDLKRRRRHQPLGRIDVVAPGDVVGLVDVLARLFDRVDLVEVPDLWPEVVRRPRKLPSRSRRGIVIAVALIVFGGAGVLAWRAISPLDAGGTTTDEGSAAPTITIERIDATGPIATFTYDGQEQIGRFIPVHTFEGAKLGFESGELKPEEGLPGLLEIERGADIEIRGPHELEAAWISGTLFEAAHYGEINYVVETERLTVEGDPSGWVLPVETTSRAMHEDGASLPPLLPGRVGLLLLGRWPDGEPFGVLFGLNVLEPAV